MIFLYSKRAKLLLVLIIILAGRYFVFCTDGRALCRGDNEGLSIQDRGVSVCTLCDKVRRRAAQKIKKLLPSPHSELLLGTTLGINELYKTPRFNDALVSSGTIHVVVVSGYNISLVFNHLINLLRAQNNSWGFFTAQIGAVIYALITGLEPPVVRAVIMVSIVLWARRYGKNSNLLFILLLSAIVMLLLGPRYLFSLSFQLSFLATLGLVVLASPVEGYVYKFFGSNVFVSDFSASFAAQVFVLPLISYHFGRINLISPLVNSLVLWTIPIITVLGFFIILSLFLHQILAQLLGSVFVIISSLFVNIVAYVGQVSDLSILHTLSWSEALLYSFVLLVLIVRHAVNSKNGNE